eukprot:125420-Rhodomonas_salina.1
MQEGGAETALKEPRAALEALAAHSRTPNTAPHTLAFAHRKRQPLGLRGHRGWQQEGVTEGSLRLAAGGSD